MEKSNQDKAKMPDVSVIIPVFNMEKYLEQCLYSLQNQTLKNIEMIVIDDGSTDTSGQICDVYAEKDQRFTIIHKRNEGLSAARNDGLDIARGKYVMFVDSDDWVEPGFCEKPFYAAKEKGAEIVVFQRMWHGEKDAKQQEPFPSEGISDKAAVLTKLWPLVGVVAWNKLYHRGLFEGERYPVGRLSEDTAVTHRLIHRAQGVYLMNQCLYHHRVDRPGSIMNERSRQLITDELEFNLQRMEDLKRWGYECREEGKGFALTYLMVIGQKAKLSSHCGEILRNADHGAEGSMPWKKRTLLRLYRFSPRLFDVVSVLVGKRI